jgi:predicted transposase/invertase (TIGR01784 family)
MTNENNFESVRYMDILTDFAFKTLLGQDRNKALLIDFLNALMDRPDKITHIQYLPTEHLGKTNEDRKAFFDIHCITVQKEWFIIEMQVVKQEHFLDRCLFYSTFPIQKQAKKGNKWNYQLKPLYHIALLDFKHYGDEHYISHLSLHREETRIKASDTLNIILIELPGFKKTLQESVNKIDRWLYCFKHLGRLQARPEELSGTIFETLFEEAEINKLTPKDMEVYNKSIFKDRDVRNAMDYSRKEGREEGIEEGIERGIEKGKLEVAKKLLGLQIPVADIARVTGLTPEQIRSL